MRTSVVFVVALLALSVYGTRTVMPWMCLERCGENVQADLQQILKLGPKVVPRVSIEAYDLDYSGNLKDNGFSKVGPKLHNAGILVEPMITTANIKKMRDLWNNMDKFISQAVAEAKKQKSWMVGYNIDFEPEGGDTPTEADARKYAAFLDKLAIALHDAGFTLTVDIAGWSPVWDHSLLAKTHVDKFITMETYAIGIDSFAKSVPKYVNLYGNKVAIGLETLDKYKAADVKARFDIIKKYNAVNFVGIWETPLPSHWIEYIKDYVNN